MYILPANYTDKLFTEARAWAGEVAPVPAGTWLWKYPMIITGSLKTETYSPCGFSFFFCILSMSSRPSDSNYQVCI